MQTIRGFYLAIVAGVFASPAPRLAGKRWSWAFALAGVALFTLMVGTSTAVHRTLRVVRAALMGSLTITAGYFGRRSDA